MRMCAVLALAALVTPVWSQETPKPGPEHELLKTQVGDWTTTMTAGGMESKGTASFKMDLGGLWLAGTVQSELFGAKFTGRSLDSFNAAKKKYVSVWVDSMSTAPVIMEGTYDRERKVLHMTGEGPGMDGKPVKYRSESRTPDAETMVLKMWIGDGKEPVFTLVYRRKK